MTLYSWSLEYNGILAPRAVTTVDYGDHYPVTAAGRAVGVVLMIVGVGVLGVVTASVAAWFISVGQKESGDCTRLAAEVSAVREAVTMLSRQLQGQPRQSRALHLAATTCLIHHQRTKTQSKATPQPLNELRSKTP